MSLRSIFLNADSYKAKRHKYGKVVVPIMWVVLVDDVEAGVGHEYLGNADAVGCLEVFEQRSHDARQSQC